MLDHRALEGLVVDIYLFDCFHNFASIGTVLMILILKHFCQTTFYWRRSHKWESLLDCSAKAGRFLIGVCDISCVKCVHIVCAHAQDVRSEHSSVITIVSKEYMKNIFLKLI